MFHILVVAAIPLRLVEPDHFTLEADVVALRFGQPTGWFISPGTKTLFQIGAVPPHGPGTDDQSSAGIQVVLKQMLQELPLSMSWGIAYFVGMDEIEPAIGLPSHRVGDEESV